MRNVIRLWEKKVEERVEENMENVYEEMSVDEQEEAEEDEQEVAEKEIEIVRTELENDTGGNFSIKEYDADDKCIKDSRYYADGSLSSY